MKVNPAAIDRFLKSDLPVVTMPHDKQSFEPLAAPGHRLILAGNGLFKEIRRPWFYARFQIGEFTTPFGKTEQEVDISIKLPARFAHAFLAQAKREAPLETGAWIVWNKTTGDFRYLELVATHATPVLLNVERPQLQQDEFLVLDIHSHHDMEAEFSPTDDADDLARNSVAVSAVLGRINTVPDMRLRLCLEGMAVPVTLQDVFDVQGVAQ